MVANQIEGKKICKLFVQRGLGLTPEAEGPTKVPLVVCITRLVAQKGLHLITNAIRHVETCVSFSLSQRFYNVLLKRICHDFLTCHMHTIKRELFVMTFEHTYLRNAESFNLAVHRN